MPYTITREDPERDLKALRYLIEVGMVRDSPTGDVLRELHDLIEEQVKPIPAEPTGDVVVFVLGRPWWPREGGVHWSTYEHSNDPPTWGELIDEVAPDGIQIYRRELPQSDATGALPTSPSPEVGVATSPPVASPVEEPPFGSIARAPWNGKDHLWVRIWKGWQADTGVVTAWSELRDPRVIRVGIGTEQANLDESLAYSNGYEKGAGDKAASWQRGYSIATKNTRSRLYGLVADLKPALITSSERCAIDKALAKIEADVEDTITGRGFPS